MDQRIQDDGPEAPGHGDREGARAEAPPDQQANRRGFLRTAGAVGAAGATATAIGAAGFVMGSGQPAEGARRMAMVIDLRRCTGCRTCAVACKAENGVRLGGFRSWVSQQEHGTFPETQRHFLPRLCNHCQEPPCQKVCPPGATYKRASDGLVLIDKDKCIGCRHCMVACPYQVRYFNPARDPEGEERFPARAHGTVDKCTFCAHRIDNGVVPSCVNTCPARARIFGDLNDPDSDVSRLLASEVGSTLLPELGTRPSVFYVGGHVEMFIE